jgi:hypothetical protein
MDDGISAAQRLRIALDSGFSKPSFSQFGKDGLICEKFAAKPNGFYVDVGCHHPFRYSNTALLHLCHGWSGINIDPDQRAIDLFALHRPEDQNLLYGVSALEGEAELFLFQDGAVNSLDPAAAASAAKHFGAPEVRKTPISPLRTILARFLPDGQSIDYLNIDAEGLDQVVLESNDWQRYRPQLVTVESHNFNVADPVNHPTLRFMQAQGYYFFAHYYCTSFYELRG